MCTCNSCMHRNGINCRCVHYPVHIHIHSTCINAYTIELYMRAFIRKRRWIEYIHTQTSDVPHIKTRKHSVHHLPHQKKHTQTSITHPPTHTISHTYPSKSAWWAIDEYPHKKTHRPAFHTHTHTQSHTLTPRNQPPEPLMSIPASLSILLHSPLSTWRYPHMQAWCRPALRQCTWQAVCIAPAVNTWQTAGLWAQEEWLQSSKPWSTASRPVTNRQK